MFLIPDKAANNDKVEKKISGELTVNSSARGLVSYEQTGYGSNFIKDQNDDLEDESPVTKNDSKKVSNIGVDLLKSNVDKKTIGQKEKNKKEENNLVPMSRIDAMPKKKGKSQKIVKFLV